jgi:hypothetical protein
MMTSSGTEERLALAPGVTAAGWVDGCVAGCVPGVVSAVVEGMVAG